MVRKKVGCLLGLAVARWTTDHYHPCSNLGVGICEKWSIRFNELIQGKMYPFQPI